MNNLSEILELTFDSNTNVNYKLSDYHISRWDAIKYKLEEYLSKKSRVCVYTSNKNDGINAMAGTILSRNIYVPLDFNSPQERLLKIIQDVSPQGILIDQKTFENNDLLNGFHEKEIIEIGSLYLVKLPIQNEIPLTSLDLAMILYTSGSTGTPKGVMISHENALTFINWADQTFTISKDDVFSSIAPLHFDLAVFDVFVSMKNFAKRKLYEPEHTKNPMLLASKLSEDKISVLYATPTLLSMLLNYGKLSKYDFSSLKYVLFAGEVFPFNDLKRLMEIWPTARFYNLYGPTETNVCTFSEVKSESLKYPVPIGFECIPNSTKINGSTKEGELMVSGPGVSLGYWNNEALNQEKYIEEDGVRWYLTGDIVKKEENGYIYIGRNDRMVKRRGYRIELGEIEHALSLHPELISVAVIAISKDEKPLTIKAFYQSSNDELIYDYQLKSYCGNHLPLYMIPDQFQMVTEMPKTSTQKIDYQKLKVD